MAARAMWKAVVRIGSERVPVKLYSAVQDRDVHFRLLHAADRAPVKQQMVHPGTEEVVPREAVHRGYVTPEGDVVMLEQEELHAIEPEPSREIQVERFLPPEEIDHRWYRRPYYLGPDGPQAPYAALVEALGRAGREGLAHWVMRKKEYVGALRLHQGYPMLIALRHAEEVVAVSGIDVPSGADFNPKELKMARQLIEMLDAHFEPQAFHDQYRERVRQLIEAKASGARVEPLRPLRKRPATDLTQALEASLARERKHA